MSKHTPGPWSSYESKYKNLLIVRDAGDHEVYVATVEQGAADEECEANANLIAAAPELLEALEELVRCNCIESGPTFGNIVTGKMRIDAGNKAKAAIAKAVGK
jgi:hypothetical protein